MGVGFTGVNQALAGVSNAELYGTKPKVPKGLNYADLIAGATKSNIANLPSLSELANLSTDAMTATLERALPGFSNLRDTGTGVIASELRGELPKDVQAGIERRAAEMGIGSGTFGSQFNKFDAARNLGLTSLDLTQRGLQNAQSWIQQAQGRTFDFSKMFISPDMAIDQGKFNWQRDWLASQIKAAPNPGKRGSLEMEGNALMFGMAAANQQRNYSSYGSPGGGGGRGGGGSGSYFGTGNNNYSNDYGYDRQYLDDMNYGGNSFDGIDASQGLEGYDGGGNSGGIGAILSAFA